MGWDIYVGYIHPKTIPEVFSKYITTYYKTQSSAAFVRLPVHDKRKNYDMYFYANFIYKWTPIGRVVLEEGLRIYFKKQLSLLANNDTCFSEKLSCTSQ